MPPAALPLIAAGVGAVGTIGGAVIASGAQHDAANQAAQAQTNATNSQLQLGQQSLAAQQQLAQQSLGQQRDIYNSNYDLLSPFVSNGLAASKSLNALLGLPAGPALHAPLAPGSTTPAATGTPATGTSANALSGSQPTTPWSNMTPVPSGSTATLQQHAQAAIAAGANPAAVSARYAQLSGAA